MNFGHLHLHTEHSYLDGFGTPEQYAQTAKDMGFNYLACTDHGNIDGLIKFQKACKKVDIKPIFGCEAYIVPDMYKKEAKENRGHITLLVKNEIGWQHLCRLLSKANLDGFYYKPRIDYASLLDFHEGLIVLTGCAASFLNLSHGENLLRDLKKKMDSDVYLEVMPHLLEQQTKVNNRCIELSNELEIPLIGTNDCHYINAGDAKTQEVLLAMQTSAKWNDKDRFRFTIDGLYLRTANEMREAFRQQHVLLEEEIEAALDWTEDIADKCTFAIEKKTISLPTIPGYEGVDPGKFIWDLAESKLLEISKDWPTEEINRYFERLSEEWKLINDKGFSLYFMIVRETICWCKQNDIMTGPGRGSVGGSLLAYLLGITGIDPLKYGLLFSRFIAEDRIDYPDIDCDFEKIKRPLVREHLEALYGKDHISSLSTFMTMKGRGTARDVCRVFDVPLDEADKFAKSIVEMPDSNEDVIEEALKTEEGMDFSIKHPELVPHMISLEKQIRGLGQHAAAVIISSEDLRKGTRCNLAVRSGLTVCNWDMESAEYVGLMKLDVLGLNTLSVLSETKKLIDARTDRSKLFLYHPESDCHFVGDEMDLAECGEVPFEFEKIPLDDDAIYKELYENNTVGVFQLEAWTTASLAKRIKASNINELSDIIALVRPGPLDSGMTEEYIKRKSEGVKWQRKHRIYEEITKNTFGLIVYQEQIMEVIHKVAGLPYSTADKIRKIVSKKRDAKEFAQYKQAFVKGCLDHKTFSIDEAEEFWEMLQKHARYSFNKCFSGDEIIDKGTKNGRPPLNIREMFRIKNDKKYAKETDHLDLHDLCKYRGYPKALSMYEDYRLRLNKIKDIRYEGEKEIFIVTTASGKTAQCTMNHKFPTKQGEKQLSELTIGDKLFVKDGYELTQEKYSFYPENESPNNFPVIGIKGFQSNSNGRSVLFEKTKKDYILQRKPCEKCGTEYTDKRNDFELHHQDGNRTNNDLSNFAWLCNSCHKAEHYTFLQRKKRYQKGLLIKEEEIISIEFLKIGDVYDVEMEAPYHNLTLQSGIIASNSHSVAYSVLGYWTAWCKYYYPIEYMCAFLTYHRGDDKKQSEMIKEAARFGLEVVPPRIGVSDPLKWTSKDGKLYVPFAEIKGIGEKTADKCATFAPTEPKARIQTATRTRPAKQHGFFTAPTVTEQAKEKREVKKQAKSKIETILTDIGAFGNEPIDDINKYFSFQLTTGKPILKGLVGPEIAKYPGILSLDIIQQEKLASIQALDLIKETTCTPKRSLSRCSLCSLSKQGSGPVAPSPGYFNVAVIGEAPGRMEDEEKKGFIGKSGKMIWDELIKYLFQREDFHVSNICKCWPKETQTPNKDEIYTCSRNWLFAELKEIECRLILAFGNTNLQAFTGRTGGIKELSGQTEWIEEVGAWVCWCVHPSLVLRNPADRPLFEKGIKNFVDKVNILYRVN